MYAMSNCMAGTMDCKTAAQLLLFSACTVMANIGMAYKVTAFVVAAYMVTTYIVMVCIFMAYKIMAYVYMACMVIGDEL